MVKLINGSEYIENQIWNTAKLDSPYVGTELAIVTPAIGSGEFDKKISIASSEPVFRTAAARVLG